MVLIGAPTFRQIAWEYRLHSEEIYNVLPVCCGQTIHSGIIVCRSTFPLKADLENRLAYWRKERERLSAELDKAAEKIADLTSISIEEADV